MRPAPQQATRSYAHNSKWEMMHIKFKGLPTERLR